MTTLGRRLLGTTPPLKAGAAPCAASLTPLPRGRRLVSRLRDGYLYVVDFADAGGGEVAPCAAFPFGGRPGDDYGAAVSPDAEFAVYATPAEAVRVDADGVVRWRLPFPEHSDRWSAYADCAFSLDGRHVWIYRPDAMLGRGDGDLWLVLNPADGRVVAETALPTRGQGATQIAHPDGEYMLMDVGEGQDGMYLFRGGLDAGKITVYTYPWHDRCLIDVLPHGREFMTVSHDGTDVVFHAFPDGARLREYTRDQFMSQETDGNEDETLHIAWGGGYLSSTTAVITLAGESEDADWSRHYVVDVETGMVGGELPDDPELLGDGTWVTEDDQGRLSHWTLR
jgi:hypothetical protein